MKVTKEERQNNLHTFTAGTLNYVVATNTSEESDLRIGGLNYSNIVLLEAGDKIKFQSDTDVRESSSLTIRQDGTYVILERIQWLLGFRRRITTLSQWKT